LAGNGLKEINVSTGDFHQKFVAENRVINAVEVAVELGISTVVVVEMQKGSKVTANAFRKIPRIAELISNCKEKNKFQIIESPWMPYAYEAVIMQHDGRMINRHNVHRRKGCESALSDIVATPTPRKLGLCCGLTREQIPELNATWVVGESLLEFHTRNASDFLKIWLAVDGPEQILAWAASKNSSINWENRYSHKCHACVALYKDPLVSSAIRDHYKERLDDVLLRYAIMARSHGRGTGYAAPHRRDKVRTRASAGEVVDPSVPQNSGQSPTASCP
jgi:hypothetical protein